MSPNAPFASDMMPRLKSRVADVENALPMLGQAVRARRHAHKRYATLEGVIAASGRLFPRLNSAIANVDLTVILSARNELGRLDLTLSEELDASSRAAPPNIGVKDLIVAGQAYIAGLRKLKKEIDEFERGLTGLNVPGARSDLELPDPSVVPKQSSAPVVATVQGGKLILDPGEPHARIDPASVRSACDYLLLELADVVRALENSNCDKRMLQAFRRAASLLQDASAANIVALGMHLHRLDALTVSMIDELATPTHLQINSLLLNTRKFVHQFAEWHEFVQNALRDERVTPEVMNQISNATEKLEADVAVVDPRIPEAIRTSLEMSDKPDEAGQHGRYGAVRSLQNVLIASLRFAFQKAKEFTRKTTDNTVEYAAKATAVGIVVLLATLAPSASILAASLDSLAWLQNYLPLIEKLMKLFGK
jgi:hypothetical protein